MKQNTEFRNVSEDDRDWRITVRKLSPTHTSCITSGKSLYHLS